MLWQLAYTEFWFTDTLWPDFSEETLLEAVENYQKRNRRYGGLKEKKQLETTYYHGNNRSSTFIPFVIYGKVPFTILVLAMAIVGFMKY